MNQEYLEDVRKQARMLLDPEISSVDYQKFKIKRLKKYGIIAGGKDE